MTRARSNSVSALTETRALNGKAVSFSRAAEEERVRAGRGTRRHDGIRSYVASFAFFAETNSFTTPRRPLRRLTDSPRAFPRRDAQLPDAAFCCATRIIYLWKETGFFRGQSRRSFARRYLRTVFFSEEKIHAPAFGVCSGRILLVVPFTRGRVGDRPRGFWGSTEEGRGRSTRGCRSIGAGEDARGTSDPRAREPRALRTLCTGTSRTRASRARTATGGSSSPSCNR